MGKRRFKGFGLAKTPRDLLGKIRHDFERVRSAPHDFYAAIDFVVTAYHMLDWLHPDDDSGRKAEEAASPLLQLCAHLANGVKHFEAQASQHQSVKDVVQIKEGYQANAFQPDAFQVGGLFVILDGQAAALFGVRLHVVDLAKGMRAHWKADARLQ